MHESLNAWGLMRKLMWQDVLLVLAILILARLLVLLVRWVVRRAAEKLPPRLRLSVLRVTPVARLLIDVGAIAVVCRSWWSRHSRTWLLWLPASVWSWRSR
jgi:hypothetical protein